MKNFLSNGKAALMAAAVPAASALMAVPAFAAEAGETGGLGNVAITTDMLKPLIDGVTANIGVILPVGVAVFAIIIGVTLVPKIVRKFMS